MVTQLRGGGHDAWFGLGWVGWVQDSIAGEELTVEQAMIGKKKKEKIYDSFEGLALDTVYIFSFLVQKKEKKYLFCKYGTYRYMLFTLVLDGGLHVHMFVTQDLSENRWFPKMEISLRFI